MEDIEKVIKGLKCEGDPENCGLVECPYFDMKCECMDLLHADARELLKKQLNDCESCPIAVEDRQPVVRCKDCKHGFVCEFSVRCENENDPVMIGQHHNFDWFCAGGERKE